MWQEAWKLYENSFPLKEIRPLEAHIEAMKDDAFHFHLLTEFQDGKEVFIGFLSWWDWMGVGEPTPLRFGEHFAIRTDLRGGGYGSEAMDYLIGGGERLLLLEIDPPVDDIAQRRQKFYERHGLVVNPEYKHVHPSFRDGTEPHELLIMSHPRKLSPGEFREFQDFNESIVLKYTARK